MTNEGSSSADRRQRPSLDSAALRDEDGWLHARDKTQALCQVVDAILSFRHFFRVRGEVLPMPFHIASFPSANIRRETHRSVRCNPSKDWSIKQTFAVYARHWINGRFNRRQSASQLLVNFFSGGKLLTYSRLLTFSVMFINK